jgi:flavin reductase (DIM6/NTAB) family NADH-FMN oxidoreductase RutF
MASHIIRRFREPKEKRKQMEAVDITRLSLQAVDLWMDPGLLLTAGTIEDSNMMTVGWGSIGCMWSRPFAQVVVRPTRHTLGYMERSDSFTLCGFPPEYRKDLQTLGTISGRDGDKLSKTMLTLKRSTMVASPSYNEASFILECRKMYHQDFDPACFIDKRIAANYPQRDYHRAFFGEIVAAFA